MKLTPAVRRCDQGRTAARKRDCHAGEGAAVLGHHLPVDVPALRLPQGEARHRQDGDGNQSSLEKPCASHYPSFFPPATGRFWNVPSLIGIVSAVIETPLSA